MKTIGTLCTLLFLQTLSFGQGGSDIEYKRVETADSIALCRVFTQLVTAIEQRQMRSAKKVALAGIDCSSCLSTDSGKGPAEDHIVPIDTFLNQALADFADSPVHKAIQAGRYRAHLLIIKAYKPRNLPKRYPKDLHLYELRVQTYRPNEWAEGHEGQSHAFQFVKINNKFKFYGLTSVP